MAEYSCNACGGTGSYEGKLRGKVSCEHCGAQWYKLRRVAEGDGQRERATAERKPRAASTPKVGGTPAQQRCLATLRRGAPLYVSNELGPVYGGKFWLTDGPAIETIEALESAGLVKRTALTKRDGSHAASQVTLTEPLEPVSVTAPVAEKEVAHV